MPSITLFLPWYLSLSLMVFGNLPSTATSATYPSFFRICAMLSFILECGTSTAGSNARCALRIRVNMSEIGSIIILPARLRHTGNQTIQRRFAERQPRAAELPPVTPAASAHGATVHQPRWARVARQLREARVITLRLQFGAERGVFFHRLGFALVALFPCFLRHKKCSLFRLMFLFGRRLRRFLRFRQREAHHLQEIQRLGVGPRARHDRHVHALRALDLVQLDFREDGLVRDAEGIIAATVELAGGQSAEVANTRQRRRDEPVEEFIHLVPTQRDAAADRLAFAELEVGDAVTRL